MRKWLIAAMILIVGPIGTGQAAAPAALRQSPAVQAATPPPPTPPADQPIRIVVQSQGNDQDDPDLAAWSPD